MLIRLCDLKRRQRRSNRPACLVGKAGEFWLTVVDRHDQPGAATLFISTAADESTTNKPLPPIWMDGRWVGPADPAYSSFFDDTAEAVVDLAGRGPCARCGRPVLRDGDHAGLRNAFGELVHLDCPPPR